MSVELDSSFQPRTTLHVQPCCALNCRIKWLKNKGATLIVIWSFLVGSIFHLLKSGYKDNSGTATFTTGFILLCSMILYPIGGWLADTRFGRYAVIKYSMWIMWIGAVLISLNEVLFHTINAYEPHSSVENWVSRMLIFIMAIGLGGFQSNIVQLGIDQLQDASATEITSFLSWYTLTFFASSVTLHFTSDCIENEYKITCVKPFFVALCLTIAMCLDFFFHERLEKEHVAELSLHSILKIIKYIIRKRKLKHVLTDDGESISVFDVGKQKYGGPFRDKQVENVRTFIWIIFVIAMFAIVCGVIIPLEYAHSKELYSTLSNGTADKGLSRCYEELSVHYFGYMLVTVVMLLYEFLIHPMFFRCIPTLSIANKFVLGTTLTLLWIMSLLLMESVSYHNGLYHSKCIFTEIQHFEISYKWFIIPKMINGFASLFLILSSFEFVWSQAPSTMKGMIFGFGYSFLGLCILLHTAIASPFIFHNSIQWTNTKLTCAIWYFLMDGLIILVALIFIIILIQRYKKRSRQTY